jgi:diketogulonate reductase-like aldo/keto reductase
MIGARDETQLRDNLGAVDLKLTPEHIRRLDEASARTPPYPYGAYYSDPSYAALNPPAV